MIEKFKDFFANLTLARLLPSLIVLVVGLVLVKLLLKLLDKALAKSRLECSAHPMVRSLVRILLYTLLILILMGQLGVDTSSLVALVSVLTLAISLAVQDVLSNLMGGFLLLTTHPFKFGDFVEIAGKTGTVSGVGSTYTTLLTLDGLTISIPNHAITTAQIVNYTAQGTRRIDLSVSASYDAPPEMVKAALLEAAQVPEGLKEPAPFAGLSGYGDSAISYDLRLWVKTEDYWKIYYQVNEAISRVFREKGIEMTYPHLNVHVDK